MANYLPDSILCKINGERVCGWHSCSIAIMSCHYLFSHLKPVDMKLRIFIAVAAAMLAIGACNSPYRATDVSGVVVSADLQRTFDNQYPTATNIVWASYDPGVVVVSDWEMSGWPELNTSDYVVRFNMDGDQYYAWYDDDGAWIGSAYVVSDFTKLPTAIHTTLNQQFSSYQITKVNREFKRDGMVYEVVLKNNDTKVVLLVDNDGHILKQKSKTL